MWKSRLLTSAVVLALLLSSTAGLATHEHSEAIDPGTYECIAEHHAQTAERAELRDAQEHQHRCLGFHLPGHRALSAASERVALFALPRSGPSSAHRNDLLASELTRVVFARGPPRA